MNTSKYTTSAVNLNADIDVQFEDLNIAPAARSKYRYSPSDDINITPEAQPKY